MPSKTISYECNVCKCRYTEWEDAKECEKSHVYPVDVTDAEYNKSLWREERIYPKSVLVAFSDGTSDRYYRKRRGES